MSIFDRFESKEELLKAVEAAIRSQKVKGDSDNEETEAFYLGEDAMEEMKSRYDSEVKNAQSLRKRAQQAEAQAKELQKENARLAATNEEIAKYNPEKQREEIARLLAEVGQLKADNKGLADQIAPLNKVIADYRAQENERIIEKALVEEAAKLKIRPEAMRDVLYRRSQLEVSDVGTVQTKADGVGVAEFLKAEFDASPLWHPQSQGGGSSPGMTMGKADRAALYQQAKSEGNIAEMFANAPEFKGASFEPSNGQQ